MFSKFFLRTSAVAGLMTLTLGLAACDSKVGDEPPPANSQEFSGTQCLSAVKPVVAAFVKGEATTRDIEAGWDCAASAVEKFRRYVRGRSSDRYTPQELATFLEKNFLNGEVITPQLQIEFMKLKQLFVGGSQDYLTRTEMDKISVLFDKFSDISVRINPYMKVFVFNWAATDPAKMSENLKHFEQANVEVQNAARSLAALIEQNSQGYVLNDIIPLVDELNIFFGGTWEFPKTLKQYMPLVQKIKKTLAGGDGSTIVPSEWARFLLLGSRAYVQYLRYYYFIKSVPETGMALRLSYLATSAEDLLSIFQDFVSEKPEQRINREEIGEFLGALSEAWPSFKFSDTLLLESMRIKQLLFGGNLTEFTPRDFENARGKVGKVKIATEKFLPYYDIYAGNWDPSYYDPTDAEKFFKESQVALRSSLGDVAQLLEGSYDLKDLVVLLEEVERLYPSKPGTPSLADQAKKYLPVLAEAKNKIFGTTGTVIIKEQWPILAQLGARFYGDYLYYSYFVTPSPAGTPERLSVFAAWAEELLGTFENLVTVKPGQKLTRAELGEFLQTLTGAFPEIKVSDRLLLEGMRLKQLLLGGSIEEFTAAELTKARGKVSKVKTIAIRILPYKDVYLGDWDPSAMDEAKATPFFEESLVVLASALQDVAGLFEGSYDLKNLEGLLEEIQKLYPPAQGEQGFADSIQQYIPLIIDTKNMVLGTADSILQTQHWPVIATLGGKVYGDYLYYHYYVKGKPTDQVETLLALSKFSNQTLQLVKDLIQQKKQGYFSKSELGKILTHLTRLKILPASFTADVTGPLLDVVLNNVLVAPDRRIDGYRPNVLNNSSVEVVRQELQIWLDTQIWIVTLTKDIKPSDGFRASRMVEFLNDAKANRASSNALKMGAGELLLAVSSPVAMTVDSQGRLNISNRRVHYYNAKSLGQLNLNRALTRILLRSFVNSRQRISSYTGANLAEMEAAFKSLRPVLVQLDLIDEKNTTFASSRFREANIFVPHSDGNTLLSFAEGVDLVGMIWSGLNINGLLRTQLIKDCLGRSKASGSTKVSVTCAANSYRRSFPKAAASLPEYVRFAGNLNADMWNQYIGNVFKAAGYIPNPKGLASLDDLSLSPHVIQYIEMIYARFDKNSDDYISTEEAMKAFPAFKGVMLELAKDQLESGTIKEADLLDVFAFILRYGHPPTSWGEKLTFLFSWKGKPEKWDIWAGRSQLSEILGYIADEVNKAAKNNKPIKMDFNLEVSGR